MNDDRVAHGYRGVGSPGEGEQEAEPSTRGARRPLASLLAEAGVASEEQLRLAVAEGMGSGERLGEIVLRRGWIDEAGLARLLAQQWGLVYLDDDAAVLEPGASALLSAGQAERLGVCVIGVSAGLPVVAVAEPAEELFAHVRSALGGECRFAVVSRSTLERLRAQQAAAEADAQSARTSAAATQAAEDAAAERLLAELDTAASTLLAWAERVRGVVDLHQRTEADLAACRDQMISLRNELDSERAAVERLEQELAHQHELMSAAKARLAEVVRALDSE
jgi:hypothetical protein